MKSVKKDLLAEIEKKAQKIRDKRIEAASNKTLEAAVFAFFKNIEDSRNLHGGQRYDHVLFTEARRSLQERIQSFDRKAKISIEFHKNEDERSWEETQVRGVTIWWGDAYKVKNNCDPLLYIDVTQMLFL
jgi:hypothetical protein